jgi:hypothetical protein
MKTLLFLLLLVPGLVSGQNRIGEWRAHVSFTPVIGIAESAESIIAATSSGIFLVNGKDSRYVTKTKSEGLAGVGISAIAYAPDPDFLLIGYEDGNLDLLQNEQIFNLSDLARKSELQDKTIHRIVCEGNFAYLCCAFGIVKIDLLKVEVAETWYLGASNDLKDAFDLSSYKDNWWVATSKGIFSANKQNKNLQDYRNWQLQPGLPQPEAIYTSLAQADGLLFAHDKSDDKIFAFDGVLWQQRFPEIRKIGSVRTAPAGLIVLTSNEIWLLGKSGNTLINSYPPENSSGNIDPKDALFSKSGALWIADFKYGLTRQNGPSSFAHLVPNSPISDQITALTAGPDAIFAATSTNLSGNSEAAVSLYQSGIWQNFTSSDDDGLKSIRPITAFAFSTSNPDEYWASSAGSGLLHFQKNRVSNHFNEMNSALGALNGLCVVNGLAADGLNNLWYTNPTGKFRLGGRASNGNFVTLPYPGMNFSSAPTGQIMLSSTGTHWVVLPDEGLFASQIKGSTENIADDPSRKVAVQSRFSNGTTTQITPFGDISSIAEDHNQQLWVGTGTGVVVYSDPDKIFSAGEFYGIQPSLDDGEGLFKPILEKEKITAIAVDGANRKWFGTAYSGVFLFSEQGDHLLLHFDSKNSPLLSDHVLSMAIDPVGGDVFFATDRGLISYKGNATAGVADFEKAYVWPNPLRENYTGGVTIDGLTDGTDIRITDVAGNLVFRSTSIGGRATWNGCRAGGARVSTGVYLIFCSSPTTKTTKIIKLLVIH